MDKTTPHNERAALSDADLDLLFSAARDAAVLPSGDLMAAVLEQGAALQPRAATLSGAHVDGAAQAGVFAQLWALIGGWPAAAGLASATVAGLVIGISPPDLLDSLSASVFVANDAYLVDLIPGFDVLGEG